MKRESMRTLSLFAGMIASTVWILLILLSSTLLNPQGGIMPFDWWIVIIAGFGGAVAVFFAVMGSIRGIYGMVEKFRGRKPTSSGD